VVDKRGPFRLSATTPFWFIRLSSREPLDRTRGEQSKVTRKDPGDAAHCSVLRGQQGRSWAAKGKEMQTFLPYPDFEASVRCLDYRRLGKQRVEAHQILKALERHRSNKRGGWTNHPAVIMWEGYEDALTLYMNAAIREWMKRGYNNTMELAPVATDSEMPSWMGDEEFHASHRANLLRKDAAHYGRYGWTESPDLPYVWPVG